LKTETNKLVGYRIVLIYKGRLKTCFDRFISVLCNCQCAIKIKLSYQLFIRYEFAVALRLTQMFKTKAFRDGMR